MIAELSIVIPISGRCGGLAELHDKYVAAFEGSGLERLEVIYVVPPAFLGQVGQVRMRATSTTSVTVIELARDFGDAVGIKLGVQQAKYETIMTLPPFEQVEVEGLPSLISELNGTDLLCVARWPRRDSTIRQIPSKILRRIIRTFTDAPYADAACPIFLCNKSVLNELHLYGDFHRFLSLLAHEQGFSIKIAELPQAGVREHYFSSGWTYLRRLLDVVAILFLTKFNRRPLRFFGLFGSIFFVIGVIGLFYVGVDRLLFDVAAANRPILILFTLLAVLGIQLVAIGLVGETLIFIHGRESTEYKIRKIYSQKA